MERRASAQRRLCFASLCSSFLSHSAAELPCTEHVPAAFKVHLFKLCRCREQFNKLAHSRSVDFMGFFVELNVGKEADFLFLVQRCIWCTSQWKQGGKIHLVSEFRAVGDHRKASGTQTTTMDKLKSVE